MTNHRKIEREREECKRTKATFVQDTLLQNSVKYCFKNDYYGKVDAKNSIKIPDKNVKYMKGTFQSQNAFVCHCSCFISPLYSIFDSFFLSNERENERENDREKEIELLQFISNS